jgi:glycosyltransferase involved in cell wall biosynthesis
MWEDPRRPRVLLVTGSLGRGGTELAVLALALGLHRRGAVKPRVAVLGTGADLGADLRRAGVPLHELGISGPLRRPRAIRRLLGLGRLVRKERVDVVHTFLFDADVYGMLAARLGRPRAVVTTRRAIKSGRPHHLRGYRWTHRFVDRIVANSERVRRFTLEAERASAEKVITIPNGVDVERFAGAARGGFRAAHGLKPDDVLVSAVGSIKPVKGQDLLLEALAPQLRAEADLRLVLAGELRGAFGEGLVARAADLGVAGRVIAPGPVDDVASLLADTDVFVLPSRSEGMSNALLEAMAAGCAAVATDVGGCAECLDGGRAGVLVPPEDVNGLAGAIDSLVKDPGRRAKLGDLAQERARHEYDLELMLTRTENLYRELMS